MIKNISLSFTSIEMEQAYKEWAFNNNQLKYQLFFLFVSVYLIIMISKFTGANTLIPLIISCICLCLELTLLFFIRKYQEKAEVMITLNQILLSIICEFYRIFSQSNNQWYFGYALACMKLIQYVHGNKFIMQSGLQAIAQSSSFIFMENMESYEIISHSFITILIIAFRYHIESANRQWFLTSQSQYQYENIISDLLPSWVVIVKYDKNLGQLNIDKINKNMKQKLDIVDDKVFREFLRMLKVLPFDMERQSLQYIKFEHTLIRLLQMKKDDHVVERYHAFMEKKSSKTKQWKFKITQVYFKNFEPSVILLFEELKEDKYEQLLLQIEQRDKSSCTNARISLQILTQQIQLLKFIKSQLPIWFNGKSNLQQNQLISQVVNQIQNGYNIFNLNFDVLNLYKISHRQLKFEINEISLQLLIDQLCEDLQLNKKSINKRMLSIPLTEVINTDRAKLISIIINLVEFLKILLSITNGDEKILSQTTPLGLQILISFKQSKQYTNCIKISLTHPKLFIVSYIRDLFGNVETSIDHKKRNWGAKNYFEMINQLNYTFTQMFEYYRKENKSTGLMDDEIGPFIQSQKLSLNQSQESRLNTFSNIMPAQFKFNVLGYPIAQYLISQLGPNNKIQFKNRFSNRVGSPTSLYSNAQQTKLSFLLYQDLNDFIQELNKIDKPILEIFQKKRFSNHDIGQKLYYAQLASTPRKIV